jgi:hypothetical protein
VLCETQKEIFILIQFSILTTRIILEKFDLYGSKYIPRIPEYSSFFSTYYFVYGIKSLLSIDKNV